MDRIGMSLLCRDIPCLVSQGSFVCFFGAIARVVAGVTQNVSQSGEEGLHFDARFPRQESAGSNTVGYSLSI